jgi:hypothetical protein
MTQASDYLLGIAKRIARAHADIPGARASMVTGSVAEGKSDFYSDVDMTVYYDELPADEILQAARVANGGSARVWFVDDRNNGGVMEAYTIDGVECQIGHITVAGWERDMASVLEGLDVTSPLQKALSGTLTCIPLFGDAWIEKWKAIARNYPDALALAMVEKHLNFFPLWGLQGRMSTRDATLWMQQSVLEGSHNILAILAGLNRVYFSTFQFKRMHDFVAELRIAPEDLAARIEALCHAPASVAASALEELVQETLALVRAHMPQVDTTKAGRRIGWRQKPWDIVLRGG